MLHEHCTTGTPDGQPSDTSLPQLPAGMSYGFVLPDTAPVAEVLWLRWPADDVLAVRVTAAEPVHYWAHWFPSARVYRLCLARQKPGAPVPCPLCPRPASEGKPIAGPAHRRYILPVELEGGAQRVWEFSDAVAHQLAEITGYQRTPAGAITRARELLGLRLVLSRLPPRSNGAVVAQLDPDPDARGPLPAPINAPAYVSETWRRAAIREGKAPVLPF